MIKKPQPTSNIVRKLESTPIVEMRRDSGCTLLLVRPGDEPRFSNTSSGKDAIIEQFSGGKGDSLFLLVGRADIFSVAAADLTLRYEEL